MSTESQDTLFITPIKGVQPIRFYTSFIRFVIDNGVPVYNPTEQRYLKILDSALSKIRLSLLLVLGAFRMNLVLSVEGDLSPFSYRRLTLFVNLLINIGHNLTLPMYNRIFDPTSPSLPPLLPIKSSQTTTSKQTLKILSTAPHFTTPHHLLLLMHSSGYDPPLNAIAILRSSQTLLPPQLETTVTSRRS